MGKITPVRNSHKRTTSLKKRGKEGRVLALIRIIEACLEKNDQRGILEWIRWYLIAKYGKQVKNYHIPIIINPCAEDLVYAHINDYEQWRNNIKKEQEEARNQEAREELELMMEAHKLDFCKELQNDIIDHAKQAVELEKKRGDHEGYCQHEVSCKWTSILRRTIGKEDEMDADEPEYPQTVRHAVRNAINLIVHIRDHPYWESY